jgi:hypothetical protein
MFRLVTLAEKDWGPMVSPPSGQCWQEQGTLYVPSGDSCREGLGPNDEPSIWVCALDVPSGDSCLEGLEPYGEPSLWSMLAGTRTLYVPFGDSC